MCILLFSNARMTVMQQEMSTDKKEKLEQDRGQAFLGNIKMQKYWVIKNTS